MAIRHVGFAKDYLVRVIRTHGSGEVLSAWEGTDDEAIAAVQADPREVFCSCDCPKKPNGSCAGMERPKCRRCSECGGSEHHWIEDLEEPPQGFEDDPEWESRWTHVCKHCDAVALMCFRCVDGVIEVAPGVPKKVCTNCTGYGCILVPHLVYDGDER